MLTLQFLRRQACGGNACSFLKGGASKCCTAREDAKLQHGSCLDSSAMPCRVEAYGAAVGGRAALPLLAQQAKHHRLLPAAVVNASCAAPPPGLAALFAAKLGAKAAGQWQGFCAECNGATSTLYFYASAKCEAFKLHSAFTVPANRCSSKRDGRGATEIVACDVRTQGTRCPGPPGLRAPEQGQSGLLVEKFPDKTCAAARSGFHVAIGRVGACITEQELDMRPLGTWQYAYSIFSSWSSTRSIKVCCTATRATLYRFADTACKRRAQPTSPLARS